MRGLPRAEHYITKNEDFVSDDALFAYQKQIIENLADSESCVIVGKCADWILRGRKNVVRIYVEAARPFCVRRTMEHMGVSEETANNTIARTDRYRADYYRYYTGGCERTNPVSYDMVLNSEWMGIENSVEMIQYYLQLKGLL